MGYKLYLAIAVAGIAYLVRTTYFPPIVNSPIVEISTGKLQGKISLSRDGRNYFEYLAVPYAQPPVGKLRYEVGINTNFHNFSVINSFRYKEVYLL